MTYPAQQEEPEQQELADSLVGDGVRVGEGVGVRAGVGVGVRAIGVGAVGVGVGVEA